MKDYHSECDQVLTVGKYAKGEFNKQHSVGLSFRNLRRSLCFHFGYFFAFSLFLQFCVLLLPRPVFFMQKSILDVFFSICYTFAIH